MILDDFVPSEEPQHEQLAEQPEFPSISRSSPVIPSIVPELGIGPESVPTRTSPISVVPSEIIHEMQLPTGSYTEADPPLFDTLTSPGRTQETKRDESGDEVQVNFMIRVHN